MSDGPCWASLRGERSPRVFFQICNPRPGVAKLLVPADSVVAMIANKKLTDLHCADGSIYLIELGVGKSLEALKNWELIAHGSAINLNYLAHYESSRDGKWSAAMKSKEVTQLFAVSRAVGIAMRKDSLVLKQKMKGIPCPM